MGRKHANLRRPGYLGNRQIFSRMQIPLLAGRDFNVSDTENSPQAMIVNRPFSDEYFSRRRRAGQEVEARRTWCKFHLHLNWQTTAAMRNAKLGVAAAGRQCAHLVAIFERTSVPDSCATISPATCRPGISEVPGRGGYFNVVIGRAWCLLRDLTTDY
jgi:hypothetical protein